MTIISLKPFDILRTERRLCLVTEEFIGRITIGNSLELMSEIESGSVDLVVTSPPYHGLKVYQGIKQLFITDSLCEHVWKTFIRKGMTGGTKSKKVRVKGKENFQSVEDQEQRICERCSSWEGTFGLEPSPGMFVDHLYLFIKEIYRILSPAGSFWLNMKDTYNSAQSLQMVPEAICFRMLKDGWIFRNKIIWRKPNQYPENVKTRFSRNFEEFFFFVKSKDYYFNTQYEASLVPGEPKIMKAVWDINTEQTSSTEHTATFPTELVTIPINACSKEGDIVFDPFSGYGTVALVSRIMRRRFIGMEINDRYARDSTYRISRASVL